MKKNKKPIDAERAHYFKILGIVIAGISFYAILNNLSKVNQAFSFVLGVLSPIIIGLCIAFVLNIPLTFIENKAFKKLNKKNGKLWQKLRRPLCLTLSVVLVLAIIVVILSLIIPKLVATSLDFFSVLPENMANLSAFIKDMVERFNLPIDSSKISIDWDFVSAQALKLFSNGNNDVMQTTVSLLVNLFNGVVNTVLGIVFAIYILAAKEKLGKLAKSLIYATMDRKKAKKLVSLAVMSNKAFGGFVAGQCIEVALIGFLCFFGMIFIDLKSALLVSCIIAVTAFIPIFGAIFGAIISAALILVSNPEQPIKALIFLIFIIVLQQIESNVIYPKMMGKQIGLPGVWVLFAVTLGGGFFGVLGIIISVPVCSVFYALFQNWIILRLEKRNVCHRTMSHDSSEPNKLVPDIDEYEFNSDIEPSAESTEATAAAQTAETTESNNQ